MKCLGNKKLKVLLLKKRKKLHSKFDIFKRFLLIHFQYLNKQSAETV